MLVTSTQTVYRYSGLSTDIKPNTDIRDASTFWETDTNKKYEWRKNAWFEIKDVITIQDDQALITYESGDIIYLCKSAAGTQLTENKWQIKKINIASAGIRVQWANGNANFVNAATSLQVVAALNYA